MNKKIDASNEIAINLLNIGAITKSKSNLGDFKNLINSGLEINWNFSKQNKNKHTDSLLEKALKICEDNPSVIKLFWDSAKNNPTLLTPKSLITDSLNQKKPLLEYAFEEGCWLLIDFWIKNNYINDTDISPFKNNKAVIKNSLIDKWFDRTKRFLENNSNEQLKELYQILFDYRKDNRYLACIDINEITKIKSLNTWDKNDTLKFIKFKTEKFDSKGNDYELGFAWDCLISTNTQMPPYGLFYNHKDKLPQEPLINLLSDKEILDLLGKDNKKVYKAVYSIYHKNYSVEVIKNFVEKYPFHLLSKKELRNFVEKFAKYRNTLDFRTVSTCIKPIKNELIKRSPQDYSDLLLISQIVDILGNQKLRISIKEMPLLLNQVKSKTNEYVFESNEIKELLKIKADKPLAVILGYSVLDMPNEEFKKIWKQLAKTINECKNADPRFHDELAHLLFIKTQKSSDEEIRKIASQLLWSQILSLNGKFLTNWLNKIEKLYYKKNKNPRCDIFQPFPEESLINHLFDKVQKESVSKNPKHMKIIIERIVANSLNSKNPNKKVLKM